MLAKVVRQGLHALTCGLHYSIHNYKSSLLCVLVDVSFSVVFECTFLYFTHFYMYGQFKTKMLNIDY